MSFRLLLGTFLIVLVGCSSTKVPTDFILPYSYEEQQDFHGFYSVQLLYEFSETNCGNPVPEVIAFNFDDPKPHQVQIFIDDKRHPCFSGDDRGFECKTNYHNRPVRIVASYSKLSFLPQNWNKVKVKVKGHYLEKEEKDRALFMEEVMKIKGVVGCSTASPISIDLAKGHPQIEQIRRKVEEIAKKRNIIVAEWSEKEGFDYLWQK